MENSRPLKLPGVARQTPQRDQILEIIEAAQGPLSAAQIFEIARNERPDMGLATIYRTLKILQRDEAVRAVVLPDGLVRFEKCGLGQHHFQCRVCGCIWTIAFGTVEVVSRSKLEEEFVIEGHDSTFYGFCKRCATGTK